MFKEYVKTWYRCILFIMTFARHFSACLIWIVRSIWRLPKRVKFLVTFAFLMVYLDWFVSEKSVYIARVIHRHTKSIALISIQTVLPIMYLFCRLVFGLLYPAYASYKAVKTKNVKDYVKWMMYWIVFALFCAAETFADVFFSWVPFYYEIKIIFVFWLLSPVTRGSSFIYRKFVHPNLAKREKEIDEAIAQARTKGYSTLMTLGHRGLTYATNVVVNTAIKSADQIKKSYSTNDLRVHETRRGGQDEVDSAPYIDDSDEEFESRLRADNRELDRREKQDQEKLMRKPLHRSKSDASESRPRRARPKSGLTRVEEVEHEHSLLEKQQHSDNEESYTEEIIYYSPGKSGHYTMKEVKSDPYATLPRTRSRQRPRLNQR